MDELEKKAAEAAKQLEEKMEKAILAAKGKFTEGLITKEEYEKALREVQKLDQKYDELVALVNAGKSPEKKSFSEQVADELEAKKDNIAALTKNAKEWVTLEVKAAGDMFVLDGVGGNYDGTYALTTMLPGVSLPPRRRPFLRQIMRNISTNKPRVTYVELTGRDGDAAITAEGAKKSQIDFELAEATAEVSKITAFIKISKEMLDDIPYIRSMINTELVDAVELKLDSELYSGTGVGNNIKGLSTYATPITVSSSVNSDFYQSIPYANRFDVIRVAQAIVAADNQNNAEFEPTHVILNPIDQALMQFAKDASGQYVIPVFAAENALSTIGLRFVANPLVTKGEFIIADMRRSNLIIRESISIQVGHENDDFTKNMVTILAEMRAGHFVKSNDLGAIRKGVFNDLIAAINAPIPS